VDEGGKRKKEKEGKEGKGRERERRERGKRGGQMIKRKNIGKGRRRTGSWLTYLLQEGKRLEPHIQWDPIPLPEQVEPFTTMAVQCHHPMAADSTSPLSSPPKTIVCLTAVINQTGYFLDIKHMIMGQ
jgi:hypothetical protein